MNEQDLMRALTDIDEELLAQAERAGRRTFPHRRLLPLAAACLCLIILSGALMLRGGQNVEAETVEKSGFTGGSLTYAARGDQSVDCEEVTVDKSISAMEAHGQESAMAVEPADVPEGLTLVLRWQIRGQTLQYDSVTGSLTLDDQVVETIAFDDGLESLCWTLICMEEDGRTGEGIGMEWSAGQQYAQCWIAPETAAALLRQPRYAELYQALQETRAWDLAEDMMTEEMTR